MHVAGRKGSRLDAAERETFTRLARGVGKAVHVLQSSLAKQRLSPTAPIRVSVDVLEGRAHAEVAIPLQDEIRTGVGDAGTSSRAVVHAVIDAMDASIKLVDTTAGDIGGDRAVLVLMEDGVGRRSLGNGLIDDDTDVLHATASAAMEAAVRLIPDDA